VIIVFSVTVSTGNPGPNITWTKDRNILSNVRYRQWSIEMEDTAVRDSGNYTCIVCNVIGCISFTFEVDIKGMLCLCVCVCVCVCVSVCLSICPYACFRTLYNHTEYFIFNTSTFFGCKVILLLHCYICYLFCSAV
jgi:hypothetical protein